MIAARVLAAVVVVAASLALSCEASPAITTEGRAGNCASCHMPEYQHADAPVHVDVKPMTCAVCHGQEAWRPSVVHHEWWPLTGAHQKAQCSFCHKGTPILFKGTPRECVSCHRPDYDASTFPGHSTFPTKCAECHVTTGWRPATHAPPRAPDATATDAGRPATPSLKPTPSTSSRAPTTTRPGVVPPPTRVPTARPPPDVTSWPSPRRR